LKSIVVSPARIEADAGKARLPRERRALGKSTRPADGFGFWPPVIGNLQPELA